MLVLRDRREMVSLEHALDIEPGPATQDWLHIAAFNVFVCLKKIFLILEEIVFGACLADIDQMIRYLPSVDNIVVQILACADVHATVHLPGIAGDYLSTEFISDMRGEIRLARGCRTENR